MLLLEPVLEHDNEKKGAHIMRMMIIVIVRFVREK